MSEKTVTKAQIRAFLTDLDHALGREDVQSPVSLYCIGGTFLALKDIRDLSKDVDFIVKPQELSTVERCVNTIKQKYRFHIDYFADGWLPNCHFAQDFYGCAEEVFAGDFQHLRVYTVSELDFVISKILSNREHDLVDAKNVLDKSRIPKENLLGRFLQTDIRVFGQSRRIPSAV